MSYKRINNNVCGDMAEHVNVIDTGVWRWGKLAGTSESDTSTRLSPFNHESTITFTIGMCPTALTYTPPVPVLIRKRPPSPVEIPYDTEGKRLLDDQHRKDKLRHERILNVTAHPRPGSKHPIQPGVSQPHRPNGYWVPPKTLSGGQTLGGAATSSGALSPQKSERQISEEARRKQLYTPPSRGFIQKTTSTPGGRTVQPYYRFVSSDEQRAVVRRDEARIESEDTAHEAGAAADTPAVYTYGSVTVSSGAKYVDFVDVTGGSLDVAIDATFKGLPSFDVRQEAAIAKRKKESDLIAEGVVHHKPTFLRHMFEAFKGDLMAAPGDVMAAVGTVIALPLRRNTHRYSSHLTPDDIKTIKLKYDAFREPYCSVDSLTEDVQKVLRLGSYNRDKDTILWRGPLHMPWDNFAITLCMPCLSAQKRDPVDTYRLVSPRLVGALLAGTTIRAERSIPIVSTFHNALKIIIDGLEGKIHPHMEIFDFMYDDDDERITKAQQLVYFSDWEQSVSTFLNSKKDDAMSIVRITLTTTQVHGSPVHTAGKSTESGARKTTRWL
jgi:hypothetical protein